MRLAFLAWDPSAEHQLCLSAGEIPVSCADVDSKFMTEAIDRFMASGGAGRGLYHGPVFWRSRVAHIDQTGHVWHGKRPGLSTAVPFLVDGCWMQSVHVFMQYLIAQYSFNFFHIFYHRFISFHPFLILRKLDEVGAIGLWRRSHMNAQKIPKAVRQWKRLKKHVICFNVKHCKSVKPSKIKAY